MGEIYGIERCSAHGLPIDCDKCGILDRDAEIAKLREELARAKEDASRWAMRAEHEEELYRDAAELERRAASAERERDDWKHRATQHGCKEGGDDDCG